MRFEREHRFPAPVAAVETAMVDPEFLASLQLPKLAPPRLLDRRGSGDIVLTRVEYQYTGELDPFARRVVGSGEVTWVHELTLDRAAHRAAFSMVPKVHADRFSCSGSYELSDEAGETVRTMTGELRIRIPLIGGRAEHLVAPGMLRRMDVEAESLRAWVARDTG